MMATITNIRLPGVYFLPAARPAAVALPPLDVAAFVGFAERGPLHAPVAVEDIDVYRAIFGGDLPLARERGEQTIYACLPTAVQTFFANGGRRCYVVRVAGDEATATRLRLPGVVSLDIAGLEPRLAPAWTSSPGRWGERLRLGTRRQATPLPAAVFQITGDRELAWETGSAPLALWPGDLLRLWVAGQQWLFPITTAPAAEAPAGTRLTLQAGQLWSLLTAAELTTPLLFTQVARLTLDGNESLAGEGYLAAEAGELVLHLSGPASTEAGDVLWLRPAAGDPGYLFPVEAARPAGPAGSPPEQVIRITAGTMLSLASDQIFPAASPLAAPERVDRLRFDLHLWDGTVKRPVINEMAFNAGHPRFWGETILWDSSSLRPNAPADPEGAQAVRAAAAFREMQAEERSEQADTMPDTIALAGLLAPVSQMEAQRVYLPLGMATILSEDALIAPAEADVGRDGLAAFTAALFLDSDLADSSSRTLLSRAFDKYYVARHRLRGLHSLLFTAEAALLAVPDAIHPQWAGVPSVPAAGAFSLPEPPPADEATFIACDRPPAVSAVSPAAGEVTGGDLVAITGARFTSDLDTVVTFGARAATAVHVLGPTLLTCETPASPAAGVVAVEVTNQHGTGRKAGAFTYVRPTLSPLPEFPSLADFDQATLLRIQQAVIHFCQARRDVVGILTLPRHFEKRHCIAWQEELRQGLGLPRRRRPSPDNQGILADLSYAAVYHPWLFISDTSAPGGLRTVPPEGAICGLIAARERTRGVWVAPANQPIQGLLGLAPAFSEEDWADLFDFQFNLVRREARDFRVMSAHTLSDDWTLLQLSVRRLLILLRKAAVERGMDFVFENNTTRLWESARLTLEAMLQFMFERGAFAGATARQAYRVVTGASVNTRQRIDQGQFVAEIQVAPSQPMEFITVLLTRSGEGTLQVTEVG